ncbi:MAG: hypothetical protein KDA89_14835 [Planctomycetaceae bacterium]|nr:hypothetical protein [Planctomycetaceae bacterium]
MAPFAELWTPTVKPQKQSKIKQLPETDHASNKEVESIVEDDSEIGP